MRILFVTAAAIVGLWIAGSYLRHARSEASATAVIGKIKALQDDQIDFYSRHGRYAGSIAELAPEMEHSDGLGYCFRVTASGNSYTIDATPLNGHGNAFFSDETLAIRSVRAD